MLNHAEHRSKRIVITLLTGLLAAAPAWARTNGGDAAPASSSESATPQPSPSKAESSKAATAAEAPSPAVSEELQQLRASAEAQAEKFAEHSQELEAERAALHEQLDRIAALETKLGIVPEPATPADAFVAAPGAAFVATPAATPGAASDPAQQDLEQRLSNLESRIKGFGPFTFAGDFRLRDEPYFGGPITDSQVRDRERYRARFYINAKLNDDISGGLGLSTGDPNDPITSNQTANQFFTRKPFNLDRAFIVYTPHQWSALTLIGGKFAYPWYRTQLTWDDDIFPEGLAQKLEWKSDDWHVLRQFAIVGFELPFGETQNTEAIKAYTQSATAVFPYPNASVHQSVVYGSQIQTRWQLASWLSFTADTALYNYHNADPIALANLEGYGNATSSSPGVGLYTLNNTDTNSYQTITATYTATGTSGTTPGKITVEKYIVAAKLNSRFALFDSIAQFDIKTFSDRWPVRLLGDYVQNTEACANDSPLALTAAETSALATANITTATVNGNCDSHQRRADWLEARFGRQQEKGDWQFAYTHMLIEREAVMSLFDFSDIRQGSAVEQNRVEALYQAHRNIQLGFTGFFGRPWPQPTPAETILKRLQFDVVYKF